LDAYSQEAGWCAVAASVLRRIGREHQFVSKAKEWAITLEDSEKSSKFFEAIADRAHDFDALPLVERRLRARWPAPDTLILFSKAWAHLTSYSAPMQGRLQEMGRWATSEIDDLPLKEFKAREKQS
jgi:hypothetical protein